MESNVTAISAPARRVDPEVRVERRAAPRRPCAHETVVRPNAGFGWRQGWAAEGVDVSDGGARLRTRLALVPGQWVSFGLPDEEGVPRRVRGRVAHADDAPDGRCVYGIALDRSLGGGLRYAIDRLFPWMVLALTVLVTANVILLKGFNVYYFWYHPILNVYALLVSSYILSRCGLAVFYRPPADGGHRPSVTVIVASKNEEASIGRTIDCVYRSDYPAEKMEVVVVDDGSTDGTYREMRRAKERHPTLQIIRFEKNRGKREGMAAGARRATGDVLVYIDSDSFVRPDAIRRLASAFENPEVGAVCGHARVANRGKNLLTRMQEVRYYVAFRVVKAAESLFSAVTCCSGCLAAYRRTEVMAVLDRWLGQTFLGAKATFGDDRSLTNLILRRHKVLYHSQAVCSTIVPETWGTFFRQQLRWKKSWIRESLLAMRFMWKRHPLAAFFFYVGVLFPFIAPLVVSHAIVLPLIGTGIPSYIYVYGLTLMALLYALIYAAGHRTGLWMYGVAFALFYMIVLVWQTYWAVATVHRNHWGTR